MTKKEITKTEIKQAEELQRLGLCQGAKEWVVLTEEGNYISLPKEHIGKSGFGDFVTWEIVGPLATASECWPEIKRILAERNMSIELCKTQINKILWVKDGKYEVESNRPLDDDLDQAFRQALIELEKEEKCQDG